MMIRLPAAFGFLALVACSADKPADTESLEGAQHVYFPDRYEYKVGDFVTTLPVGYYEFAMNRLAFSQRVLEDARPRPVAAQEKYLVMPAYALAPKRHFLLLDQRHLLVYSERFDLDDGYAPRLEVLRRTGDAGWTDVSDPAVPQWARTPKDVSFPPARDRVTVTGNSGESHTLVWKSGRLVPED